MYITLDGFSTIFAIGSVTPTTVPIAGVCRGDVVKWGAKMYFSCGGTGTNAFLAVLQ